MILAWPLRATFYRTEPTLPAPSVPVSATWPQPTCPGWPTGSVSCVLMASRREAPVSALPGRTEPGRGGSAGLWPGRETGSGSACLPGLRCQGEPYGGRTDWEYKGQGSRAAQSGSGCCQSQRCSQGQERPQPRDRARFLSFIYGMVVSRAGRHTALWAEFQIHALLYVEQCTHPGAPSHSLRFDFEAQRLVCGLTWMPVGHCLSHKVQGPEQ